MSTEQLEIELSEFFRSDAGASMGRHGDSMGWTAIRTARHFGIPLVAQPDAGDAARYFASGPNGHFFTDSLELAETIVCAIDPHDDWTITDTAALAGPQS